MARTYQNKIELEISINRGFLFNFHQKYATVNCLKIKILKQLKKRKD